jgi:AcrR family transcriptional regulator
MHAPNNLGLRERGKLEKRVRIAKAAREIFAERGFDGATTRDIASRAGVSVGTLFVYAPDKAQLLKAVFEWQLDRISETHGSVDVRAKLVDQLIEFLRPRYELWGRDPRLSRTAMRIAVSSSLEPAEAAKNPTVSMVWSRLHQGIADIIERYKRYSKRCAQTDSDLVARAVFAIYMTHVQLWIAEPKPHVEDGLTSLAALLDLICAPLELQKSEP